MSSSSFHHQKPSKIEQSSAPLITFEPCLAEAKEIVQQRRKYAPHKRIQNTFIALANGDTDIGLLAYYLWRQRILRT